MLNQRQAGHVVAERRSRLFGDMTSTAAQRRPRWSYRRSWTILSMVVVVVIIVGTGVVRRKPSFAVVAL